MTLAIFDLDNTLIAGDSDHAWGQFLIEQKLVDPQIYQQKNDRFYQDYVNGTLDIMQYLEFCLAFLTKHSLETLNEARARFIDIKIKPMWLTKAFNLVEYHRKQGHNLLVITSTNRFVCEPIVKLFDIPHLIATEPEIINQQYTGKVSGIPSYQTGKVKRLMSWLKKNHQDLAGSFGYSDSHNDIPLLDIVDNPIVVDGDPDLLAYAKKHGWQSISLRT